MTRIACILLGAGAGKRFGGDKLAYPVDGVSMAERALRLHASLPYAARILVTRPGDEFVSELGKQYGFTVAVNERAAEGIGTSAARGMEALLSGDAVCDGALYGVCDQPYLTKSVVQALTDAFAAQPDRIVAPFSGERRGNPVIFPVSTFKELSALEGDRGGGMVLQRHLELLWPVPVNGERELMDMDTRS